MAADPTSPHLRATREIRAVGPGPEAEDLRAAYLDLLKLSLCDLAGAGTTSVIWNSVDPVHSRELKGEELKRRVVGQDWPLHGLSMVGLTRLDDLQRCVESIVADDVPGDMIEAGSWRGGATILIRATLNSLGEDARRVWVADSFQGFPTLDQESYPENPKLSPLSDIDFLSIPLDEVKANFARFGCEEGVEFVPGFFEDTLPTLPKRKWSLVRLDGDTYEATWLALEALYPSLSPGGYLVVDDYSFIEACQRAVDDFRESRGITEPIEEIDWNSIRWRREAEADEDDVAAVVDVSEGAVEPPPTARGDDSRSIGSREHAEIPTWREVELARELEESRESLQAAETALQRLRGSPLAGPAAWARRRLGRRA